ncbi:MAG TPA: hypothetical protein PLB45_03590 [Bacilli bacterium]|nr:hypothetical protein [Bacilli bacterium]HPZ23502.1 hypothetical protein [Bacilli bacterium]HQC83935.1 hypothetical protein [Bacilli bacterium]
MQTRMDKYKVIDAPVKSRTQKNSELYDEIKKSSLTRFDVNSNMSVIDTNAKNVNVNKVREFLDERYRDDTPKRKSIDLPVDSQQETTEMEPTSDTKEYDINAIIEKAKQGKNVDYNKERLKKVREAQYEILNNLDLEIQKVSLNDQEEKKEAEEKNLMSLINTITQLELENKQKYNKQVEADLDLLSDLRDDEPSEPEEQDEKEDTGTADVVIGTPSKEEDTINKSIEITQEKPMPTVENNHEDHIEETLTKLNIDMNAYDDFNDIAKNDKTSIIIKIIIFLVIILLLAGAAYILNNLLGLDLFNF